MFQQFFSILTLESVELRQKSLLMFNLVKLEVFYINNNFNDIMNYMI